MNKLFRYNNNNRSGPFWLVWYDEPVKGFDIESFVEADRLVSLFVEKDFKEIDNIISHTGLSKVKVRNYYFITNILSKNLNKFCSREKVIRWMVNEWYGKMEPKKLIKYCLVNHSTLKVLIDTSYSNIFYKVPKNLLEIEEKKFDKVVGQFNIDVDEVQRILYRELFKGRLNMVNFSRSYITPFLGFYLYNKYNNLHSEWRA